jgi:hypothetical protein
MTTTSQGFGDQLFSGAATFGKVYTNIALVVTGLILVVCLVAGIYLIFFKKSPTYQKTPATVVGIQCTPTVCALTVEYTPGTNAHVMQSTVQVGTNPAYHVGQGLTIYYDPNNPQDITLTPPFSNWVLGLFVIGFGVVVFGFVALQWYIVSSSKAGAAAIGALDFWNFFGR